MITTSLLLVSASFALAQSESFTLRVDVPLVSLDVSVTDIEGHPVLGLRSFDFEILENETPQKIQYFESSVAPYHVYILVDGSGSTRHKWVFMRNAIETFALTLQPQDQLVVGIFGENLRTLNRWNDTRQMTIAALEQTMQVDSSGRTTEFYWALEQVIEDGFDEISQRKAVIVLTDGRDTSLYQELVRKNRLLSMSDENVFQNLSRHAADSHVPIFFVAINTDKNFDSDNEGIDEYERLGIIYGDSPIPEMYLQQVRLRMERLAEISGGRILFPKSVEDVAGPFEEISKSLNQAYRLGYAPEQGSSEIVTSSRRIIKVRLRQLNHSVEQSRTEYRLAHE